MANPKLCPVMSGFVTLPKSDSIVHKLVEVPCKQERCEWWDSHYKTCSTASKVEHKYYPAGKRS